MDTPVGRATKASQWRYPYPPDPTDDQLDHPADIRAIRAAALATEGTDGDAA